MQTAVRNVWVLISAALLVALLVGLFCLQRGAGAHGSWPTTAAASAASPLRIGLVPEANVFELRPRYRMLTDYLSRRLGRPVELVTLSTYQTILEDFAEDKVEAAFLGSFVAALTMDRQGAKVVAKPEFEGPISSYHGVIFVPVGSPIHSVDELAGRSLGVIKATTAGNLFPLYEMQRRGILNGRGPKLRWLESHDSVVNAVLAGQLEAGAVKNLELEAHERANPGKLRRLAESPAVPNMPLVVRGDLANDWGPLLRQALLEMDRDAEGHAALQKFGALRFLPCPLEEFRPVYDMVDALGADGWKQLGVEGPPLRRPAELGPAATPATQP